VSTVQDVEDAVSEDQRPYPSIHVNRFRGQDLICEPGGHCRDNPST
jgi:hypothetical protein